MKLVLNLLQLLWKYFCLGWAGIYLFFQNLRSSLENFDTSVFHEVTNSVTFVISDDTLWTNVDLVVLTEILRFLLWMTDAILHIAFSYFAVLTIFSVQLIVFDLLQKMLCLFAVKTIEDGKVFDELFDIRTEVCAAGGARKNVTGS